MIRRIKTERPPAAPSPEKEAREERRLEAKRLELTQLELKRQALNSYLGGKSPAKIAEDMGLESATVARKLIDGAINEEREDRRDKMRDVAELRLNALFAGNWDKAIGGDKKAGTMILDIMDRQFRLYGLNSPVEIKIQDELRACLHIVKKFVGNEVYGQIVQELASRSGAPGNGSPRAGGEALPALGELH